VLSPLDESSATSIQLYNELYAYYIIDESIVTDVFSFMTSQAWHLCVYYTILHHRRVKRDIYIQYNDDSSVKRMHTHLLWTGNYIISILLGLDSTGWSDNRTCIDSNMCAHVNGHCTCVYYTYVYIALLPLSSISIFLFPLLYMPQWSVHELTSL